MCLQMHVCVNECMSHSPPCPCLRSSIRQMQSQMLVGGVALGPGAEAGGAGGSPAGAGGSRASLTGVSSPPGWENAPAFKQLLQNEHKRIRGAWRGPGPACLPKLLFPTVGRESGGFYDAPCMHPLEAVKGLISLLKLGLLKKQRRKPDAAAFRPCCHSLPLQLCVPLHCCDLLLFCPVMEASGRLPP